MRLSGKGSARRATTRGQQPGARTFVPYHLADEPVEACPPSAGYKLRKFARKHKRLLSTAAAFAALLLLGIAASTLASSPPRPRASPLQKPMLRKLKIKSREANLRAATMPRHSPRSCTPHRRSCAARCMRAHELDPTRLGRGRRRAGAGVVGARPPQSGGYRPCAHFEWHYLQPIAPLASHARVQN